LALKLATSAHISNKLVLYKFESVRICSKNCKRVHRKKVIAENFCTHLLLFDTHIAFLENKLFHCLIILALFTLLKANAEETTQKKFFFHECVSELIFATIKGLGEPSC
jgi:hypothetical protein